MKKQIWIYSDDIAFAGKGADLEENRKKGKLSAFLTLEEGGVIHGDLDRVKGLYDMGIRLITLTWNYENCIGYPNSRDLKDMGKGLKPFGFSVIDEMNRLGMIVDVSHLSEGGFWDVVSHSKTPPVASHSNARALRIILVICLTARSGLWRRREALQVEFLSEFLGRERFMPNR